MQPAKIDTGIVLHAEIDNEVDKNTFLLSAIHESISANVAVHGGDLLQGDHHEWTIGFDDAANAVKCALSIQKDNSRTTPSPLKISVHVEDFADRGNDGLPAIDSRRIAAAGTASSVLISSAIEEKIADETDLETLEAGVLSTSDNPEGVLLFAMINEGLRIPNIRDARGIGKPVRERKIFASPQQRNLVVAGLGLIGVALSLLLILGV